MAGAPGLGPPLGDGVALRELVQLLEGVADLHGGLLQPGTDGFHKVLLNGFFDDDHGFFEACLPGIEEGVVQDGLPLGPHRVDLLQPAVAAAHTGGHDHKNRFLHI